jgi:hypothetical protein
MLIRSIKMKKDSVEFYMLFALSVITLIVFFLAFFRIDNYQTQLQVAATGTLFIAGLCLTEILKTVTK